MSDSDSSCFYGRLPVLDSFFDVTNPNHYHPLPDDWWVGITDIKNSTKAIENNRYKTVNILGVSPIIGILNAFNPRELPYNFGGDGCVICIPPDLIEQTKTVFASCKEIGKAEYELELRAALFPVNLIRREGYDVRIAKFKVSDHYRQAAFMGGGIDYAVKLLKTPGHDFAVRGKSKDKNIDVNFNGLECRWQEVSLPEKTVASALVRSNPQASKPEAIYNDVLQKLSDIYGFDSKTNPLHSSRLNMTMSLSKLTDETKFRTFGKSWLKCLLYLLKAELQILLGKFYMYFKYKSSVTDWSLYKPDLVLNSDSRKFDDMLRLVISGTAKQHREFETYLAHQFKQSKLAYGIHYSESAIVTCMVQNYHRQHIHFVDGKDGGYAYAARDLKKKLKSLQKDEPEKKSPAT